MDLKRCRHTCLPLPKGRRCFNLIKLVYVQLWIWLYFIIIYSATATFRDFTTSRYSIVSSCHLVTMALQSYKPLTLALNRPCNPSTCKAAVNPDAAASITVGSLIAAGPRGAKYTGFSHPPLHTHTETSGCASYHQTGRGLRCDTAEVTA